MHGATSKIQTKVSKNCIQLSNGAKLY